MKGMDNMNQILLKKFINDLEFYADLMSCTRFNPRTLELNYAKARDVAELSGESIVTIMQFVKKLSKVSTLTYDECMDFAEKWFVNDYYDKYNITDYSLLYSNNMVFIIPDKNGEPIKIIKL